MEKEGWASGHWITGLMLGDQRDPEEFYLGASATVFSLGNKYAETSKSCASHKVFVGSGTGGWPVDGICFSILAADPAELVLL